MAVLEFKKKIMVHTFQFMILGLFTSTIMGATLRFTENAEKHATTQVQMSNQGVFNTIFQINIPAIEIKKEIVKGIAYSRLLVKGLSTIQEPGKPDLPSMNHFMVVPKGGAIKLTILDQKSTMLKDILVYPGLEEHLDNEFYWDIEPAFQTDPSVYGANVMFPTSPIRVISEINFRGIHLNLLQICPILHNPVNKTVQVFHQLTLQVEYVGGVVEPVPGGIVETMVKSLAVNGSQFFKHYRTSQDNSILDEEDDYLIITTDKYQTAADLIGAFKQKQGYDVQIMTRSSWTTSAVKDEVKKFYTENNKAEYFLIIGDFADVPAIKNPNGRDHRYFKDAYTDLNYALIEGSDYYPEMARGRLTVNSASQAEMVVNKIIKYQLTPPDDEAFYKKVVGAAYFQDKNNDGEEDRRYSLTMEELRDYLTEKWEMDFERIYTCGSSVNPKIRNDSKYADGQPVADYLKKPTFPWKGNTQDIMNAINQGTFLVMHRDHGSASGWSEPSFKMSHADKLTNGDLLPLIFSLNCTTGDFKNSCLSETLLRNPKGGCVAVYGASATSPSGPNCALCHGLTDAFFPGTAIKARGVPQPPPPVHDPIYTIGDALNWGCISVEKYWKKCEREFVLYQCFGDPAMELYTAKPIPVTATHPKEIGEKDKELIIKGHNIVNGMATLYNEATKTIIGRTMVDCTAIVMLPITKPMNKNDKLLLYIWGHNTVPYTKEISVVSGNTNMLDPEMSIENRFSLSCGSLIHKNKLGNVVFAFQGKDVQSFSCAVYDMLGNKIKSFGQAEKKGKYTYTLGPWNFTNNKGNILANGVYAIKASVTFKNKSAQTYTAKLGVVF